jgi:hypothetical protein
LKRRGAISGSSFAAAARRYSASTSSSVATGGAAPSRGPRTACRPRKLAVPARIAATRRALIPSSFSRRPSQAAVSNDSSVSMPSSSWMRFASVGPMPGIIRSGASGSTAPRSRSKRDSRPVFAISTIACPMPSPMKGSSVSPPRPRAATIARASCCSDSSVCAARR